MPKFNYERRQCEKLGYAESYGIKLSSNASNKPLGGSETKWMLISTDQFRRITDILTEGGDVNVGIGEWERYKSNDPLGNKEYKEWLETPSKCCDD